VTAAQSDAQPVPTDPNKGPVVETPKMPGPLDGAYTIVSGERNGTAIPEAELKDQVIRFAEGEMIGRDKDNKVFVAMTYTLDTGKKPWKVDMKEIAPDASQGGNAQPGTAKTTGLAKKDGELVTVIYALPGGDAPTEFKTKDKQQMFVLKSFLSATPPPSKFGGP
jgi:uncharacterized protein (TIGR03067 family)